MFYPVEKSCHIGVFGVPGDLCVVVLLGLLLLLTLFPFPFLFFSFFVRLVFMVIEMGVWEYSTALLREGVYTTIHKTYFKHIYGWGFEELACFVNALLSVFYFLLFLVFSFSFSFSCVFFRGLCFFCLSFGF